MPSTTIDLEYAKKILENRRNLVREEFRENKSESTLAWYSLPLNQFIPKTKTKARAVIRFLPPWNDKAKLPGRLIRSHYDLPKNNPEDPKKIHCLETYNIPCPICDLLISYKSRLDVKLWFPKIKSYFNVLVIEDNLQPDLDSKTPRILGMGGEYPLIWLIDQCVDERIKDITDPYDGCNVIFCRESDAGKFSRTIEPNRGMIAPTKNEVKDILNKMYNFDDIWRTPDDVYINKIKDIVERLREVIENKLLTLPNIGQSQKVPKDLKEATQKSSEQTKEKANTHTPKQTQPEESEIRAPEGAPECFGIASEYDSNSNRCIVCSYDFPCEEIIKRK